MQVKMSICHYIENPFLGNSLEKPLHICTKAIDINMFIGKMFVVGKYWISPKYASIGNRINHWAFFKCNILQCEYWWSRTHISLWINNIILSENTELMKNTYNMISSMYIFTPEKNNAIYYLGQQIYVEKHKYMHEE